MKRVVLVGAGHAHLYLARRAADFHDAGEELVLVDPGCFWYSGLATGVVGGRFSPEEDQVDPAALAAKIGGRHIAARAVAVDPAARRVSLDNGEILPYDLLSLNIGSEVDATVPGMAEHAWLVKPISNLARLRAHIEGLGTAAGALRMVVVGGGPTGCEVAANLVALLRRVGAGDEACAGGTPTPHRGRVGAVARIVVLHAGSRLAGQFPVRASERLRGYLESRGIEVRLGVRVAEVTPQEVVLESGEPLPADLVVGAMGLRAPAVLTGFGLPLDENGNLRVNTSLQVEAFPEIFGAGDCIAFAGMDLPKVGVFGVRQAPVLHHNLLASVEGKALRTYRPQKRYLLILNLGGESGLAVRGRLHAMGGWALRLKYWLDMRFLRRYR